MEHFWKCQAPSHLTWRRQFLKDLKQKLIDLGTGPEVRELLVAKLGAIIDGENLNHVPEPPVLAEICEAQKAIKWEQWLLGRFATAWNTHTRTQPGILDN